MLSSTSRVVRCTPCLACVVPCRHSLDGTLRFQLQESPAEFAAQTKKNTLIALAMWETDRAKLKTLAQRATDGAAAALKAHEAEREDLIAQSDRLKERIRNLELSAESIAKEVQMADDQRFDYFLSWVEKLKAWRSCPSSRVTSSMLMMNLLQISSLLRGSTDGIVVPVHASLRCDQSDLL